MTYIITPRRLPGLLSQSVLLWDGMKLRLERIAKGHTRMIPEDKLPRNLLVKPPYGGYLYPPEISSFRPIIRRS